MYQVRSLEDGSLRALKLIPVKGDGERERREVELALGIQHLLIIRTHEAACAGNVAWLLQELAEGTLRGILRRPEHLSASWQALSEVAAGLWSLHQEGVIHRDIKPSNVLLTPMGAKLGDLGLARAERLVRLTRQGQVMGTPIYMAPEQARGEEVTAASDVYSLAVLFFEALEGRLPYPEVPPLQLVMEVAEGNVGPFVRARELVDEESLEILRLALDRDPAVRPESLMGLGELEPVALARIQGSPVAEDEEGSGDDSDPADWAAPVDLDEGGSGESFSGSTLVARTQRGAPGWWEDAGEDAVGSRPSEPEDVRGEARSGNPTWLVVAVRVLELVVFLLLVAVAWRWGRG